MDKMYPRKKVPVGEEEVAEDPRRRELYRVWLARNSAFMKNFVPLVEVAMFRMATDRFGSIRVKTVPVHARSGAHRFTKNDKTQAKMNGN